MLTGTRKPCFLRAMTDAGTIAATAFRRIVFSASTADQEAVRHPCCQAREFDIHERHPAFDRTGHHHAVAALEQVVGQPGCLIKKTAFA